jgi:hypothetical protein
MLWEKEIPVQQELLLSIVDGDVVIERYNAKTGDVFVAHWAGSTGTERWEVAAGDHQMLLAETDPPHAGISPSPGEPQAGSAVGLGDLILVPFADGPVEGSVNAYRASDGTLAWTESWECKHRLVAAGDRVLATPLLPRSTLEEEACAQQPLMILDESGENQPVPPGPLGSWERGDVAPGAGFVHVGHHGLGPDAGVALLDLDALLNGRVEVVRKFHLPEERSGFGTPGFRITSTTAGPVMVGFNSFFYGSGDSSGAIELKHSWALLLPQEVSE